jgi:hypothetical protein
MHLKISSHRPFSRDFLERQFWLLLTIIAFVFLVTIVARADEKPIRSGLQKCGALVLLEGKDSLEARSSQPGQRVGWAECPASPQFLEFIRCGESDHGAFRKAGS